MNLRKFLFGDGQSRRSVYTMNTPRTSPGNQNGEGGNENQPRRMNPLPENPGSCNPPRRGERQQASDESRCPRPYGDDCTPYGRLIYESKYGSNIQDRGNDPTVLDFNKTLRDNESYRVALWTGEHLQAVAMTVPAGGEIPAELHEDTDQMLFITEGSGEILMGRNPERLSYREALGPGYAAIVPAGMWHTVRNLGRGPLRLISVYGPPHHPYGTLQRNMSEGY